MGNRVSEKPLAGKPVSTGRRKKRARAFMNQQRHSQLDHRLVQRIVIGIVDVAALDRIRPDEYAFEAEFIYGAFCFFDGEFHVLDWNHADTQEPFSIRSAVIVQPIIVGAAQRRGVSFFLHRG